MMRRVTTFLVVSLAAACARTPPEQRIINDAAEALGGRDRILAIRTLTLEGGGTDAAAGGGVTPDGPPNTFRVTGYRRQYDLASRRMSVEQVRTAQFPHPFPEVRQPRQGLDGAVAFDVGRDGVTVRASAYTARTRRLEMLQHPLVVMREALQTGAWVTNLRTEDGRPQVDVTTQTNGLVTVAFDPVTRLPASVSFPSYDPNWGDIAIKAQFSDYQDVGGLRVPARIVTHQDEWMISDRRLTTTAIDGDVRSLEVPESVRAAAEPSPPPVNVTVEEVAPGIWWLGGDSHHSVVFEFPDNLKIFELPLSAARTKAVIERARALRPNKPVMHAIISHHHLDHAGGFREAVAEGLIIVAHRGDEAFFRKIAARPQTSGNEGLSPTFLFVEDELHFSGPSDLYVFAATGNSHADPLLYAWAARDRILVQADFYDVNWRWQPWGDNFLENLKARGLNPALHVPIHGRIQTHAEVLRTLASKPKGPPPTE